jgi:hypothetical protein
LKRPEAEERLVLATGRYLGEGFDDASLDTLFLTQEATKANASRDQLSPSKSTAKKTARIIGEQRIDSGNKIAAVVAPNAVLSAEMAFDGPVGHRDEGLLGALAASDSRLTITPSAQLTAPILEIEMGISWPFCWPRDLRRSAKCGCFR